MKRRMLKRRFDKTIYHKRAIIGIDGLDRTVVMIIIYARTPAPIKISEINLRNP